MHKPQNNIAATFFAAATGFNNGQDVEEDVSNFNEYPLLDPDAFHGIAGRITRIIEPETEADPIAILIQFLIAAGCAIGHGPFFHVGATRHHTNLFSCLVGRTSRGRKGSAMDYIVHIMRQVDCPWVGTCMSSGLSTGEGLIHAVRDQLAKKEQVRKGGKVTGEIQEVIADFGVDDKRLLVTEGEFARPLKAMSREANILSEVMRSAWDNGNLRSMVKTNPYRATDAHIAIVGHITREELHKSLLECDFFNGFANRFLWASVQRSKPLPFGGSIPSDELRPEIETLIDIIGWACDVSEMHRDAQADEFWASIYDELTADIPGRFGAVIGRGEAQVLRISMILALLDRTITIRIEHIRAALALWQYCIDSARYLFVANFEDPHASKILSALLRSAQGMSRAEININVFGRHLSKAKLDKALSYLRRLKMAECKMEPTVGRPTERWFALRTKTDDEDYD